MMNTAIKTHSLTVIRGGRAVLDALDLTVHAGQVTGLLGPSGCGKSTLMRAVVGVQKVQSGGIDVLGRPAGSKDLRARVGYLTQSPSVYPNLSVLDNLRFFAAVLGAPADDPERVVQQVDLADHAHVLVSDLSGGQRNRVSLGVALLGSPELLVLDEPTVGLDPVLRRDLWALFHRLADFGVTVLVSSHVMDEAQRCDRLLLMRAGVILADDPPDDLLRRIGADDIETAFLRLVDDAAVSDGTPSGGAAREGVRAVSA
ncbi:MAG: ABC transporter ATP-binding protein [Nocardioidaceae bacterium]